MTAPHSAKLALARELLDDIETDRLPTRGLLMKASRLAAMIGDEDATLWFRAELGGYDFPGRTGKEFVALRALIERTGRKLDGTTYAPIPYALADVEARIRPLVTQVSDIRDKVARGLLPAHASHQADAANTVANKYRQIATRVHQLIHDFAVSTYHRLEFGEVAESIFSRHAAEVDALLRDSADEVIQKIPAIYERLSAGDSEAVGHALNSCRRMIWDFADRVSPAGPPVVDEGGAEHPMNAAKHLNRLEQFLRERCDSVTRRERLMKNLRAVHDRVSGGIKHDIAPSEAQALFLSTYLTLGEILIATGKES